MWIISFPFLPPLWLADGLISAKYCPSLALLSSVHDARIVNIVMATFWRRIAAHCYLVWSPSLSKIRVSYKTGWCLHPPSRDFFVDILCSDDNVKWVIKLTEAIQGTQIIWIISSALTKFDSKHKYRSHSLKLGCWVGNTVATDYRQTQSQFYYQTLNRNKL